MNRLYHHLSKSVLIETHRNFPGMEPIMDAENWDAENWVRAEVYNYRNSCRTSHQAFENCNPPPKTPIAFLSLPAEIHLAIIKECNKKTTLNLCLTNKWMHKSYFPILYNDVRLGLSVRASDLHPENIEEFSETIFDNFRAIEMQNRFFETLILHPDYFKYIRVFRALLWVQEDNPAGFRKFHSPPISSVWRLLKNFVNLRGLLLFFQSEHEDCERKWDCRGSKSGVMTMISFEGTMLDYPSPSILNAVDPTGLTSLAVAVKQKTYTARRSRLEALNNDFIAGEKFMVGVVQGVAKMTHAGCTALNSLVTMASVHGRRYTHGVKFDGDLPPRLDGKQNPPYKEWHPLVQSAERHMDRFDFHERRVGFCVVP